MQSLNYIKISLKNLWSVLKELRELYEIIIIIYIVFPFLLKNKQITLDIVIGLGLFTIIVFILLFILIKKIRKSITSKLRKVEISNDLSNIESLSNLTSAENIIPKNTLLNRWYKDLVLQSLDWSPDAIPKKIHFSIIVEDKLEYLMQCTFTSSIKHEYMNINLGYLNSIVYHEIPGELYKTGGLTPFFIKYKNWRKAILTGYMSVRDKLPKKYSISLHHRKMPKSIVELEYLSISFRYKKGKVDGNELFQYNGKQLVYENKKQIIDIY